ncbi:hypothetical protein BJ138DRAFT_256582 [Hygrophoropsis aurantiaca]|uniref:Uncharacterized protein n=1 Tax=Hygrophoropsis aurantiaca TaxID=72124 RepID=A0ACB8A7J1_9AGAM|nr:hypothetical protein BJ138DRAFT_256582 [Hygrophoropsis aurantiaca]
MSSNKMPSTTFDALALPSSLVTLRTSLKAKMRTSPLLDHSSSRVLVKKRRAPSPYPSKRPRNFMTSIFATSTNDAPRRNSVGEGRYSHSSDQESYRRSRCESAHGNPAITSGRLAVGTKILERFGPSEDDGADVVPVRTPQLSFVPLAPPSYHRRRSDIPLSAVPPRVIVLCSDHHREACIPCRELESSEPLPFPF